jgi:hypothetical protein
LVLLQISSDPSLREDRTRVRVKWKDKECFVSSVNSDEQKSNKYLELIDYGNGDASEGEGYVFSWANELSAPLVGVMSVRQAHGTLAAANLAASICQGERKVAEALGDSMQQGAKTVVTGGAGAAANTNRDPHFSHLALCADINPPLGWVLSDITRKRFKPALSRCMNQEELMALEKALVSQ